jgi:hypothetical protein
MPTTAWAPRMDVYMLHRDLLLAFAAMPVEGFEQRRIRCATACWSGSGPLGVSWRAGSIHGGVMEAITWAASMPSSSSLGAMPCSAAIILSDWLSWELYSEALYQLRNTAGIHLKFIATTKLTQGLRRCLSYSSEVNELPEEILEACGRDDF